MHKNIAYCLAPLLVITHPVASNPISASSGEPTHRIDELSEESLRVGGVNIKIESRTPGVPVNKEAIIARLQTKAGDPFSQYVFDQDLKKLAEEYDRVEPITEERDGAIYITLKLWEKPIISSIQWKGNARLTTQRLQSILDIEPYTTFDRSAFNAGLNKVREHYIKKGYFESQISYRIIPSPENNEVRIEITVEEGHTGRISGIYFYGFTSAEKSDLLGMINSKKHNLLISLFTGEGKYHDEIVEQDKIIITNYLQNQGYADARVHINVKQTELARLAICITAVKGEKYSFNDVHFSGNALYSEYTLQQHIPITPGSTFSPDKLRNAVEAIKDLYGKDGYIDVDVQFTLTPSPDRAEYNLHFTLDEGRQYKIGLIRVYGNTQTQAHVILRESLLVPGELFDSRKLKATQQRLMATGHFKSANVYPIQTEDTKSLGENYRDVIIEVDEQPTGNISFFFGLSSQDSIFGGVNFAENNFNYKGLGSFWKNGLSALRGGGEFVSAKVNIGKKQQNYNISWMTPYLYDTLWRFGFDANYSMNALQSKDYDERSMGGSLFATYPLSQRLAYTMKFRAKNSLINFDHDKNLIGTEIQERNSGPVFGYGNALVYSTTDNPFKPHRGVRLGLEAELAAIRRHSRHDRSFPFSKLGSINAFYYPVSRLGTLKTRVDAQFVFPLGDGKPELIPLSERFFLGGNSALRGYTPFCIGPKFEKRNKNSEKPSEKPTEEPTGGVSSLFFSVEYQQNLHKLIDGFVFFDAGSIAMDVFAVQKINMSYGVGIRLDIGNKVPLTVGYGFPINPDSKDDVAGLFFSMGGEF